MSLGLDRTRELLARLGNPQDSLRFVHVAGTNGKGSTCACMASILQAAGYKVGLFTSLISSISKTHTHKRKAYFSQRTLRSDASRP